LKDEQYQPLGVDLTAITEVGEKASVQLLLLCLSDDEYHVDTSGGAKFFANHANDDADNTGGLIRIRTELHFRNVVSNGV
jgi:hypothetical protein